MNIQAPKNHLAVSISMPYRELPFSTKIEACRQLYQQRTLQAERFTKNLLNQKNSELFRKDLVQSIMWNG